MLCIAVPGFISNMLSVVANLFIGRFAFQQEDPDIYSIGASISFLIIVRIILRGNALEQLNRKSRIVSAAAATTSLLLIFFKLVAHKINTSTIFTMVCVYSSLLISVVLLLLIREAQKPGTRLRQRIRNIRKQISIPITHTSNHPSARAGRLSKLNRLIVLKENGTITEDEYQLLKTFLS